MRFQDSRGLPISTRSSKAAQHYRDGVDLLLSAWPGTVETLARAAEADPTFALAEAALARAFAVRAQPHEAKRHIEKATGLVEAQGTDREKSHVATLALAIGGQSAKALDNALAHTDRWPRDAIIFGLPLGAFGLFAFSGMRDHDQARVDLCDRHAAQFADDDWWFLTYRGWSHAENGNLTFGLDLACAGFELRRANANGAHAVSHAMFEAGATGDAERFIGDWLPTYDRSGVLHGHIAWHEALSALERGDAGRALEIYDQHVQPSASRGLPINIMSDTVSLLWRMEAYGHMVPKALWEEAAAYARAKFPMSGLAFVDAHLGLAAAATGDRGEIDARVAALTRLMEAGTLTAGAVVPALCRAALEFAEGNYDRCVEIVEPMADDIARIGGSGAQREVFEDTLLLALMRSGQSQKASAMLDKRLHRRPSRRDTGWRQQLPA